MSLLQTFLRMIRRRRPAGGSGGTILNQIAPIPPAPARQHANASTAELERRAAQLQARAASGSKGCVAARRELSEVRHAILREAMRLTAGV